MVMKRNLVLALGGAIAALSMAAPASAETVQLNGSVPVQCSISPDTNNVNWGTSIGNQGNVTSASYGYSAFCNVPFTATINAEYGRFQNENAAPGDIGTNGEYNGSSQFFAAIDYTVNGISSSNWAAGDIVTALPSGPIAGSTTLTFDLVNLTGTQYLVAGPYQETLTVTLTPGTL